MFEYSQYSPQDYLHFSPTTYFRLIELYNNDMWPLQIVALLLGGGLIWVVFRRNSHQDKLIWALLASSLGWVAYAFYIERYATINIIASYMGWLFLTEAILLFVLGTLMGWLRFNQNNSISHLAGWCLILYALVLHPAVSGLLRQSTAQMEYFALMPDPTLIATFGFILLVKGNARWFLLPIALILSGLNTVIAWLLDDPTGYIVLAAACLTMLFMLFHTFVSASKIKS